MLSNILKTVKTKIPADDYENLIIEIKKAIQGRAIAKERFFKHRIGMILYRERQNKIPKILKSELTELWEELRS